MQRRLALLLTCVMLLAGCSKVDSGWQEQFDLGVRYLSEGDYEEAILAFTAAIEIDPKNSENYLYRGDAYVMGARDLLSREEPRYEKAEAYLQNAEDDYQKALQLDPDKQAEVEDRLKEVEELSQKIVTNATEPEEESPEEIATENSLSAYISVVEQAISEELFLPESNGMLCDMDGDGTEELILIHEKAEMDGNVCVAQYHVCSIYSIEDGVAVAKMDAQYLNSMAGAPKSYVGMVNFRGDLLFLIHSSNGGAGTYETTDVLYDPVSLSVCLTLDRFSEWNYNSNPITEKERFQINDSDCSAAEYQNAIVEIEFVNMVDDGSGVMTEYMVSGMPLSRLLEYLQERKSESILPVASEEAAGVETYLEVVQGCMTECGYSTLSEYSRRNCRGLLYDINGDGQEELILQYEGRYMLAYKIWTIKEGKAVCLLDNPYYDGIHSEIYIAKLNGTTCIVLWSWTAGSDADFNQWLIFDISSVPYPKMYSLSMGEEYDASSVGYYINDDLVEESTFNETYANLEIESIIPLVTDGKLLDELCEELRIGG